MSVLQEKMLSAGTVHLVVHFAGRVYCSFLNLRNQLTGGLAYYLNSMVAEIGICPPHIPTFFHP